MNPLLRIARFGVIGGAATLIHYAILYGLSSIIYFSLSVINVCAFLVATGFSFTMQQRFTFRDRLGGKRLNGIALFIFLFINSGINWVGGLVAIDLIWFKSILPLLAAGVNFCTYWLISSSVAFRR